MTKEASRVKTVRRRAKKHGLTLHKLSRGDSVAGLGLFILADEDNHLVFGGAAALAALVDIEEYLKEEVTA